MLVSRLIGGKDVRTGGYASTMAIDNDFVAQLRLKEKCAFSNRSLSADCSGKEQQSRGYAWRLTIM
jgi:hypothetical protein